MYEVITVLLILTVVILLIRYVLWFLVPRHVITWVGFAVFFVILGIIFLDPDNRFVGIFWGILSFPLRPIGMVILLLGFSLSHTVWVQIVRRTVWFTLERVGKVLVIYTVPAIMTAFMILVITSLPITAYFLTAQTEQRVALDFSSQRPAVEVQAIAVLNDGTIPSDPVYRVRTQLSNPVNSLGVALESRLSYAADLYREQTAQGNYPLVIVSAGPQAILARPEVTPSQAINTYLEKMGVPSEQIRIDSEGYDLRSSAIAIRKLLLGPGSVQECRLFAVCENGDVKELSSGSSLVTKMVPIVVVTPAMTMRRAISTFCQLYFDVTPRPTDFYVFQIQAGLRLAALTDFIPNAEALTITTRVIDEYLAWVYYFMRGWLKDPLSV